MNDKFEKYKEYANKVVSDKGTTYCYFIKLACERYLKLFERDNIYFDSKSVERVINFISKLKHFTGRFAGKPFVLSDWQLFAVYNIFGWKWKKDDTRVTRNFHLEVARKNGKSAFLAAIAIYMMIADNEADSQTVIAANSAKQAGLLFNMSSQFCRSIDPKSKFFKRYRDSIKFDINTIKVVAADAQTLDGLNLHCAIIDELHEAPNADVFNVLSTAQGNRTQPLLATCTTAGFDLSSFAFNYRQNCIDVLKGLKDDDTLFPLIFTLDEKDDWHDDKIWQKANPNLGITIQPDYLKTQITKADNDISQAVSVQTKLFNLWVSSSNTWIPMEYILKSMKPFDLQSFNGSYCNIGLDLASTSDLTCISVLIQDDGKYYYKTYYFLPSECLKKSNTNSNLYNEARQCGELIITDGNVTDYDAVVKKLMEINSICPIEKVSYDQWNATQLIIKLQEVGLPVKPFSQSISSMNRPTKELERNLLSNNVILDNNRITRFCFQNAVAKLDYNDNVKIIKESYQQKIDGVISCIMALGGVLEDTPFYGEITSLSF